MEPNSSRLPECDGQGSSGANIGVQASGNIHVGGNVHNYFAPERPEHKKTSFFIHEFPPGSEFFCGREEVLLEVEKNITDCEKEELYYLRIVAIIGLGGMGKSEIAKQIAKRLQPKYDFIFWFDAQIRRSLESGFKQLASILNVSFPSEDSLKSILPDVYRRLAENYRNAIFIFDNAEELKARPGIYGLEEYLVPNVQCKKPVFLITSRYPWGSVRQKIKCIQLDRLSDDESYKCLLKYMDVEDHLLPTSLKKTTVSLAKRLEGIPLLLSLVGGTAAGKAEEISLDTVESMVQSYNNLLEGPQLDAVTGESKYEERLEIILRSTVLNMEATPEGKIAAELFYIIALLSPDSIQAGLVNGIYSGKRFKFESRSCRRFVWENLDTSVSMGLKKLMKISLIKIERKKYKRFKDSDSLEYDMIKVHRLIQTSTQNWLTFRKDFVAQLEKILRLCEHEELQGDHIHFLLNFCMRNYLPHFASGMLAILSAWPRFDRSGARELFKKVKTFLRAKKLDPDSDNTLCVLEIIFSLHNIGTWSKVKRLLLELSPEFAKRPWVIRLSCDVVDRFKWYLKEENNADFCDWMLKNYKECNEDIRRSIAIFQSLIRCDRSRDWFKDEQLTSTVLSNIASVDDSERWDLWRDIWGFIHYNYYTGQRVKLLELLVNGPEGNVFATSLQFSQDLSKAFSLNYWTEHFCDCIIEVAKIPELRKSLLADKLFLDSLWDITSFTLTRSPSPLLMDKAYWRETLRLIGTWCLLFHHDVAVYECFGRNMDSGIQDRLRQHRQSLRDSAFTIDTIFYPYRCYMREFADAKHCSTATRNWIQEVLN